MNEERKPPAGMTRRCAAVISVPLLIAATVADTFAQASPATQTDGQAIEQGKFYCNTKALTPTEREQHRQLTDKLIAMRKRSRKPKSDMNSSSVRQRLTLQNWRIG